MAQPAVSTHEERTELLGVPVFWPKPSPDSHFSWEIWIGQFFLPINLRKHCDPKDLLIDPAEVFDDPPPRPERIFRVRKRNRKKQQGCERPRGNQKSERNKYRTEEERTQVRTKHILSQSRPASQITSIICPRNRREETFSPKLPSHYPIRYKFQGIFRLMRRFI